MDTWILTPVNFEGAVASVLGAGMPELMLAGGSVLGVLVFFVILRRFTRG